MFWNILCPSAQNPTFPYPKTYGSALRNVRFPYAKHRTYTFILQSTQSDFPLYPSPPSQHLNLVSSDEILLKKANFYRFSIKYFCFSFEVQK